MLQVTIQKTVKDKVCSYSDLDSVIEKIKTGGSIKARIEKFRSDSPEKKEEKTSFPAITFQGEFKERKKDGLINSSGLLILDFDKTGTGIKNDLSKIPYIHVAFVSISGDGIKALVKIPKVYSDEEYKQFFYAITADIKTRIGIDVDGSGADVSRACFFSYDPDIYVNKESSTWDKKVSIQKDNSESGKLKAVNYELRETHRKMSVPLNFIRFAQVGERHTKILKASILTGGYIAAGIIDEYEAVKLLEREASAVEPDYFHVNKKAIRDGINEGRKTPIYESVEEEIKSDTGYGKLYYTLNDVKDQIDEAYSSGFSKGKYVGWKNIGEHYTLKEGTTTYIYGAPACGKTQFWHEILINCSKFYKMRHAIFSPETGTAGEVFQELMEIYSGKDFYSDRNRQMTVEEKEDAENFINKYFIVIDPSGGLLKVEDFYAYVDIIEREYNTKIHTTTIDPWNELSHSFASQNNRQDIYLEWALGAIRQNAKINKRHNAIITHIAQQDKIKDKDSGMWYYPPTDFRQVAGGQSWSRKGMNMINIWRPPEGFFYDGHPLPYNASIIDIQKVKPKYVGSVGECLMFYDIYKHGFYEEYIGKRMYAMPEDEYPKEVQQNYAPDTYIDPIQSDIPF